jgi:hypothetical protein
MSLPASVLGTTHYLGFDDPSGYAVAGKRCFGALAAAGADVVWVPFTPSWDWELGYAPLVPSSLGGTPDTVVAHLPAEYYGRIRECYPEALVVGHTVWETERIRTPWLGLLEVPDVEERGQRAGVRLLGRQVPVREDDHAVERSGLERLQLLAVRDRRPAVGGGLAPERCGQPFHGRAVRG